MQYALKLETNSMTLIHKNIGCFGEKKKTIFKMTSMDVWTTF